MWYGLTCFASWLLEVFNQFGNVFLAKTLMVWCPHASYLLGVTTGEEFT